LKVWRSDDAGRHWALVSQLNLTDEQMYVAVVRGQSTPVVYLFTTTTMNVTRLMVSLNGGSTWNPAPMPSDQLMLLETLQGYTALTSDGSVVATVSADGSANDGTLYAWKVGDPQWSPIGPAPQTGTASGLVFFLALPSLAGGPDTLWYVANPSDFTMEFYRLQL
jgi:hypothetical protein